MQGTSEGTNLTYVDVIYCCKVIKGLSQDEAQKSESIDILKTDRIQLVFYVL